MLQTSSMRNFDPVAAEQAAIEKLADEVAQLYIRESGMSQKLMRVELDQLDVDEYNRRAINGAQRFIQRFKEGRIPRWWMVFEGSGLMADGTPSKLNPTGNRVGKTTIAAAITKEVCRIHRRAIFLTEYRLTQMIQETQGSRSATITAILDDLMGAELVVIDDAGKALKRNEFREEWWFEFINRRVESELPLVITTNLSRKMMQEVYGADIRTRFDEMCWDGDDTWFILTGPRRGL